MSSTCRSCSPRSNARSISAGGSTPVTSASASSSALKSAGFVKRAHRVPLHPLVGLLARHAAARQLEQHGAREHHAARSIQILPHPLGIHHHPGDDAREAPQHVVEGDEAVGQDDALDRRVRDVALVPQRVVLERGPGVGAQQPRQADDLLAADRVALVRHGRRALLPLGERLLDLADLGLLQAADLERALLERRSGDRQRRQQLGVTVALDHLRTPPTTGSRPSVRQTSRFDRRREVGKGADRAREHAHRDARRARARGGRGRAPARRTTAPASGRTSSARRARRACGRSSASGGARRRAAGPLPSARRDSSGSGRRLRASAAPARCR